MVAKQGAQSAIGVVQKKYGEEAGNLLKESVEIGEKIAKIPKPGLDLVKTIAQKATEKAKKKEESH